MEQLKIGEIKIKQTTLINENDLANPYYVFSQTIDDTLYDDITSNYNWMNIGPGMYDYNFCRDQVILLTSSLTWSALTLDEKIVASRVFAVDKTKRDEVLSESEQYSSWGDLINSSQNSRFRRWEAAKKYVSFKLSPTDASDLGKSTSELCNNYINYNIITKVKDNVSGLFDYLKGEGDYVGSGYPSKTYWTQQDQDGIMNILENGIY